MSGGLIYLIGVLIAALCAGITATIIEVNARKNEKRIGIAKRDDLSFLYAGLIFSIAGSYITVTVYIGIAITLFVLNQLELNKT